MRRPSTHTAGIGIRTGARAAALLAAAGLLITAAPAGAATPSAAVEPPAEAIDVIPGARTDTPSLVDGIREAVDAKAGAADAAKAHLAAEEDRYKIAEPGRDLAPLGTLKQGAEETVRLQQKHRGVPVLGGQYLVRMEKADGKRVVTGTSGKYFTGLTAGVKPAVDEATAVRRAVTATMERLGGAKLSLKNAPGVRKEEAAPLTGDAAGLVVVPRGEGVLAYQVTVRGAHPATGAPVLQQVYVDARAGYPLLSFSGIKTLAPERTAVGTPPAAAGHASAAGPASAAATGSGVRLDGSRVPLEVRGAGGRHLMADDARMAASSKNSLTTWDARDKDVYEVLGTWPEGLAEFSSPTPEFGKEATESGAVDAHWAAGQVYDYYKQRHGRDGLDGRGGAVDSLVGVTEWGMPFVNAFWDGTKMVYGGGDETYRPLSADLDVVGHEMTHGVVENTANLVYAGQSGALNEAIADYLGNAIDVDRSGTPMDHPDAGLIGEDLCRTGGPRACALRDLNDGATTSKDFLGVTFSTDNGGVHLNSTIFSGALWDMRQDLGAELADKIVYKALTSYLTPLDGFTDGRNAVLAAAREVGATAKQISVTKRSFNAHGIVDDWELALGVDSDELFGKLNTTGSTVQAGGGWWTAAKSNDDGTEPYSVYAGRADGRGAPKLMSPNDGRYHVNPATDGATVVWTAYGETGLDILARPIAGGPVRTLFSSATADVSGLRVDQGTVVFETLGLFDRHVQYLRPGDKQPTAVDGNSDEVLTALPSVAAGRLAYAKLYPDATTGAYRLGVELRDLATGRTTLAQQLDEPETLGQTGLNKTHVFWLTESDSADARMGIRRADLDGSDPYDISAEGKPAALIPSDLTVSDTAVTVNATVPDTAWRNETLPKNWQFTTDGSRKERVSCNRGEQISPAAVSGTQVVWLDGTTGWTTLATRPRPAGACG
ncbi:M4 family metallopeptidase [Streptomyces sp. ODS05-4]|uniref:M4 family metallopeptidase n=1 Tax=Streptomyces sp. ODS05-4 TaxID=2944939 RepID=UPI00210BA0EB|nr:M4 family metallopeptidase [Streptomyces sp. ODS05-4]